MPRTSKPKPDYTEIQFSRALKRAGFVETTKRLPLCSDSVTTRRFRVGDVDGVPAIYSGRFGSINLRLTLKHLQTVAALSAITAPKRAPKPTPLEVAAGASA